MGRQLVQRRLHGPQYTASFLFVLSASGKTVAGVDDDAAASLSPSAFAI